MLSTLRVDTKIKNSFVTFFNELYTMYYSNGKLLLFDTEMSTFIPLMKPKKTLHDILVKKQYIF